ncbi:MAG: bL21 family ribosomal protein [Patescibacteria group bacterium]
MDTAQHAVIETGGKQYLVKSGDIIRVEKLVVEPAATITLRNLLTSTDSVTATVVRHTRAEKVSGRIFRNKTRARRYPHGHKQHLTELKIATIA